MEERDVVNIGTKFMKSLITRLIKKTIKAQFGIDADVEIGQFTVQNSGGRIKLDLKVHGEMSQSELPRLLKLNER